MLRTTARTPRRITARDRTPVTPPSILVVYFCFVVYDFAIAGMFLPSPIPAFSALFALFLVFDLLCLTGRLWPVYARAVCAFLTAIAVVGPNVLIFIALFTIGLRRQWSLADGKRKP
jgi:hypothetical protein